MINIIYEKKFLEYTKSKNKHLWNEERIKSIIFKYYFENGHESSLGFGKIKGMEIIKG